MRLFRLLVAWLLLASAVAAQEDDLAALEEQALSAAVQRVAPCVVQIETIGGLEQAGEVLLGDGPTTGLIVSADGYVLSSAFNFLRQPSSILVTLPNGRRAAATITARDHSRMLVLLKVTSDEPLPVPTPVAPDEVQVGQWAIAVGRTYDAARPNMSVGIVSAKDRIWGKAIQTDAKISPSNYGGPLIDIRGRVMGVLVPMSPTDHSEVAGAEWYDSGIGFAVPLSDILPRLESLKSGQNQHPGLLGIALKAGDIYTLPAELAACPVKSPAYVAGLRTGDVIVEINGRPIERQAHLKHILGRHYAGDMVTVVAQRGADRLSMQVTLTDKLIPYEHPFLGILPRRGGPGIVVRHVYAESGAAEAGLQVGDQLLELAQQPVADADAWRLAVANLEPKQATTVAIQRGDERQELTVTLGALPTDVPEALPAARERPAAAVADQPAAWTEIKIPEEPNECHAFVPRTYSADAAHGIVVYLRPPGNFDRERTLTRWRDLCEAHDLILLAPQPRDNDRWTPPEIEFVRKTIDHVMTQSPVDKTRVVLFGEQAGGSLAYLLAFRQRELIRGVVTTDAAMPVRSRLPDNDPVYRLAFFITYAKQSPIAGRVEQGIELLREMKYPVTVQEIAQPRELSDEELGSVARWIDTLDRI